jgi:hypothetical protein
MTVQEIVTQIERLSVAERWMVMSELVRSLQPEAIGEPRPVAETIAALRGRGRGEHLVEKLLESRGEDKHADERFAAKLRS